MRIRPLLQTTIKKVRDRSPKDRSLTLNEALEFIPDLEEWYLTGYYSDRLLLRVCRGILNTSDRATWLIEILHDIAINIPANSRVAFESKRNYLLNSVGI